MSRNGSGTYSLPAGNPVVTGTTISSTWANNTLSDIATALTQSIASDGQTTPTANLPMGTFKHTGVAVGASLTDYARYDQLQNSAPQWLTGVAGTDTITASAPVTPAAYAAGQTFRFVAAGANTTTSVTLNISSLGAKAVTKFGSTSLSIGDIYNGAVVEVVYDGTQFQAIGINNTGYEVNDFRLTLTSATPVTTADVATATTIYLTPFVGNKIGLYDGAKWNIRATSEISLALGTLTASLPYDVFCYDNSGTPTLEFLAWTNTTTRATALTYQDGILVKTGATTRRYIGTFYTISTTQTCDSSTAGRYLFNYYNQVYRKAAIVDATATWTQTAGTRQANASTANQFNFVVGVEKNPLDAEVNAYFTNDTGNQLCAVDIGLDSTTVGSSTTQLADAPAANASGHSISKYLGFTGVGKHSLVWQEYTGGGTTTWTGSSAPRKSGMVGGIWA